MNRTQYICHRCSAVTKVNQRSITSRPLISSGTSLQQEQQRRAFTRSRPRTRDVAADILNQGRAALPTIKTKPTTRDNKQFWGNDVTVHSADHAVLIRKSQSFGNSILNSQTIPDEEEVLKALTTIKYAVLQLNASAENNANYAQEILIASHRSTKDVTPEDQEFASQFVKAPASLATNLLSSLAHRIVAHPPVFISEAILEAYVAIHTALQQPETLPEIFDLYAHKPIPVPNSSPITYTKPSGKKHTAAIPEDIANAGLNLAIKQKKLTLALDIISSTFGTPAWRRNRFIRKASPAVAAAVLTPMAAIPLAQMFASTTQAADPHELMTWTWVGILTYVGAVGGLGYIATTTFNDHMKRVTWLPGLALRRRWLREDERAAADRVALAWGFKQQSKWGLEEGADWELFKTWCIHRHMLVDAPELMEGME